MGKILFFNIPAQGHMNPALPVVAELVRRGEQVICVNTAEFRQQIEATGAEFREYPDVSDLEPLMKEAGAGDIARNAVTLVQIGERLIPFTTDLIQREKPDCVMHDTLAGWAEMTKRRLNLRAVALCVTFVVTPESSITLPVPLMLHTLYRYARLFPEYWRTARQIQAQYQVKSVGLLDALMCLAEMNIVFTSRQFQPSGNSFKPHFKFVGTSMSSRPSNTDFPFEQLTKRPLVYISLGTINNMNVEFYRACFAAFGAHPGQFIMSIGKNTKIADLGEIPNNFIVRNFVPQLEILQRVDVFITHGGLNSTHEGFYYGVPLIVIPQQVEQAIVASQVVKYGAGISLGAKPPFGKVTANELQQALAKLLSNTEQYKTQAKILGDSLREAGGYARAADEIQAFMKNGSA